MEAHVARRLPGGPPVAGDRVELRGDGDRVTVVGVAPRRSLLARGEGTERRPRPLAANADLLIVASAAAEPPLRPALIDRYLVVGEVGSLEPALLVTKTDLPHDERRAPRRCSIATGRWAIRRSPAPAATPPWPRGCAR